ncbi:uncharacterized protein Z520_05682 [Fonsecaea multimorphosa CBS 102226]|uniref:Peptidase A1 domain-containing protein n=1 Tax=Fonsecaea multimorphosa CBS 102226 TaxID=1442371 RepID=A0A0D2IMY9_9EURO|nr:uncharacterized protein Z520_05682 [Fonsecaea multimorphosa CBS 102226]KIX98381.1 hypothetical protein Z520_05682 [Fonsecaea multimorphosa CBS 102226]OAL24574.1 hypothetical protein AYO22_05363 [Fonsecaea multimorphosa]
MGNLSALFLTLRLFQIIALALCSSSAQHLVLNRRGSPASSNATSGLLSTTFGTNFDVNVTIGGETFPLLVDTGSSDTYVMKKGYRCFDKTNGTELPQSACLYGSATYTPSATYSQIPNEIFGVQYGAGIASGVLAHEEVTLAGITVKNATIAVANSSSPQGDGVNSGILGLAYPALTSGHPANVTDNTTYFYNRLTYNPLLFVMHQQGLIEPYFSLALARTPQNSTSGFGGYLSLGGLPPVPHSDAFTSVSVEIDNSVPIQVTSNERVRAYWTVTVSSIVYGPGNGTTSHSAPQPNNITTSSTLRNGTSFQAFIDSGNFFSYLPDTVVTSINSLFSPPAVFDATTGLWYVDCAATAPQLGLEIGNQTFFLDGRDLIYQTAQPSSGEAQCVSNLLSSDFSGGAYGEITLNIIGAAFLKNVLTVFDFGANEVRMAKLEGEVTASEGQGQSGNGSSGRNGNVDGISGSGTDDGTASKSDAGPSAKTSISGSFFALLTSIAGVGIWLF